MRKRLGATIGPEVVVVLPAYNAERTLRQTIEEIPFVRLLLVDDASTDGTADLARSLGIETIVHPRNLGYGANQKTCYRRALNMGAEIVVMLHPDYQYPPRMVSALAAMIGSGEFDVALASRMLGRPLRGGMPLYKYVGNKILTRFENLMLGARLSEYHTGFRAWSREVLQNLPFITYSDDFLFDNQMLADAIRRRFRIGEISCPTRYTADSSSISFRRSVKYGLGVLAVSVGIK